MVDLKEQCFLVPGEQQNMFNNNNQSREARSEPLKSCTGCHTTITPLWRGGPAGPKTLCNACGIKYHKKRRALLGMESGKSEKPRIKKKKRSNSSSASTSCSNGSDEEEKSSIRIPLKIKMVLKKFHGGGADHFLGRKLGEEEQAAILLMALSCGSVYA